jgi:hypothetical protein
VIRGLCSRAGITPPGYATHAPDKPTNFVAKIDVSDIDVHENVLNIEEIVLTIEEILLNIEDIFLNIEDILLNIQDILLNIQDILLNIEDIFLSIKESIVDVRRVISNVISVLRDPASNFVVFGAPISVRGTRPLRGSLFHLGHAVDPNSWSRTNATSWHRRKRRRFYFATFTVAAVFPSTFIFTTTFVPTAMSLTFAG